MQNNSYLFKSRHGPQEAATPNAQVSLSFSSPELDQQTLLHVLCFWFNADFSTALPLSLKNSFKEANVNTDYGGVCRPKVT